MENENATATAEDVSATTGLTSGLTEGRIVHYVMADGQHRAGLVVRAWRAPHPDGEPTGLVQLQVFLDGTNDTSRKETMGQFYGAQQGMTIWATSVHFDKDGTQPHTWHWPERA